MKLKDYFFDNFMGIDESTVLTAVEELTDGQKNLVYYIWGVDSKRRNPNSKKARDVISQIYKDYPNWNGKYLASYIEKSTLDIMGTIFNTNINAVNKDSAAFMNAHFDKEENDERNTDYDLS